MWWILLLGIFWFQSGRIISVCLCTCKCKHWLICVYAISPSLLSIYDMTGPSRSSRESTECKLNWVNWGRYVSSTLYEVRNVVPSVYISLYKFVDDFYSKLLQTKKWLFFIFKKISPRTTEKQLKFMWIKTK